MFSNTWRKATDLATELSEYILKLLTQLQNESFSLLTRKKERKKKRKFCKNVFKHIIKSDLFRN